LISSVFSQGFLKNSKNLGILPLLFLEKKFYFHKVKGLFRVDYLSGFEKRLDHATVHPDNDDYLYCAFTLREIEALIGELSYEANHNRSKRIAGFACELADSLETQFYQLK